jgi:hypothetical protein
MERKQLTAIIAVVAGMVLLVGGIVDHAFAAPKAALCNSGLGQLGQALDGTVAHDCGLVTALESAVGWLIVVGLLALLLGLVVLISSRLPQRQPNPQAPQTLRTPQPPPPTPAPQTPRSQPPEPQTPARPWWEQT